MASEQIELMREIRDEVIAQGDVIAKFKADYSARVDSLETRLARPGALSTPPERRTGRPPMTGADGQPLLEIRAGADIEGLFRSAGRLDPEFDDLTFSDWMRAVAGQKATDLARRALAAGTDSSGGYTVPSVLMPQIFTALTPASSLLQAGARIISVDAGKDFTFAALSTLPAAGWREEGGAVAESDPLFRAVVAKPRSLAFFFRVSRELVADGANLDSLLTEAIAGAMAAGMDRAGLLGSGTAPEPRGLRNIAGVHAIGNGAAGASLASVRFGNLLSAWAAITGADAPAPTGAVMAPRTAVGFAALADTTTQPLRRPDLLAGLRMIPTSQLPTNEVVGASSDCSSMLVGDFARAAFVMREGVSVQRLNETFAANGQIGFVAHARVDFVVENPKCFAVVSGIRP